MSNNKQSSVEWLVEKLKSQGLLIGEPDNLVAFQQAKAMHKQEQENTWYDSRIEEDMGDNYIGKQKSFEQYYNETYGS
jgi:hypothetical protein